MVLKTRALKNSSVSHHFTMLSMCKIETLNRKQSHKLWSHFHRNYPEGSQSVLQWINGLKVETGRYVRTCKGGEAFKGSMPVQSRTRDVFMRQGYHCRALQMCSEWTYSWRVRPCGSFAADGKFFQQIYYS